MDEHMVAQPEGSGRSTLTLQVGRARFPIVTFDGTSCLIRSRGDAPRRGLADIYEGDHHRDRCLIVLARPEGEFLRLTYKRRSRVSTVPPRDYAPE